MHDEQQLQRLDALAPAALRPEFKAGLDQLTSLIFERTRPKQMEGVTLTGPMLAALAQSFVGAINQGAVPTIATSWQVHPLAPLMSSLATRTSQLGVLPQTSCPCSPAVQCSQMLHVCSVRILWPYRACLRYFYMILCLSSPRSESTKP